MSELNKRIKAVLIGSFAGWVLLCNLPNFKTQTPSPTSIHTVISTQPEVIRTQPGLSRTPLSASPTAALPAATPQPGGDLLKPEQFQYLGAFRLPEGEARPLTFAYGGNAMTYHPVGDSKGASDGFPGSLFVSGHDRLPYGELTDGGQIAEISIPAPIRSKIPAKLNQASFVQNFHNVARGWFDGLDEIPRMGMQYLDTPATGAKIHLAWGQHLQPDPPAPSHAWFNPDLSAPAVQGAWFIGSQSLYSVNGYMLEIPTEWADNHVSGRYLGTGRFRDGGWSGMGPALFAYRPWVDARGSPAARGARLPETVLLRYPSSETAENIQGGLRGYQHPDEWEGAAWLTTPAGKSAVVFAGTKSTGSKYWYGYVNPAGAGIPCVDTAMVAQFTTCRLANGAPCPAQDLKGCANHTDYRGWWSTRFDAQLIFYDPADLARVASGQMAPDQPQPYAVLDLDETLCNNPDRVELDLLGTGDQRRYRIGDITFDRARGILYILEYFADEARPVVHVWKVT